MEACSEPIAFYTHTLKAYTQILKGKTTGFARGLMPYNYSRPANESMSLPIKHDPARALDHQHEYILRFLRDVTVGLGAFRHMEQMVMRK